MRTYVNTDLRQCGPTSIRKLPTVLFARSKLTTPVSTLIFPAAGVKGALIVDPGFLGDHKEDSRSSGIGERREMNETGVGAQTMAGAPPAGWFRDPLAPPTEPTRSRWWTGTR